MTVTASAALVLPGTATSAAEPVASCEDEFQDRIAATLAEQDTPGLIADELVTICGHTAGLAEFESIRQTGIDQGLTFAKAIRDYADQNAFVDLANDLKDRYPEDYAGAEYVPGGDSWIAFRAQQPSAVDLSSYSDVEVITDRGFSEAQLTAELEARFAAMTDLAEVDGGLGAIDIVNGAVEMELQPADGFTKAEAAQAIADATAVQPQSATVPVEVEVVNGIGGEPQQEQRLRGGGNLTSGSRCTAAFGVRGGTVDGLLTAYHCSTGPGATPPSIRAYDYEFWRGDGVEATVYFVEANVPDTSGFGGEVAWYGSVDRPSSSWFNVTDSTFMSASGTNEVVLGQSVQVYGQTNGRRSSTVMLPATCMQYRDQPYFCSMALVEDMITGGGDSGGPWFSGTTALGVHSGYWHYNGVDRSVFSKIEPALDYLDLTLLTTQ